MADDNTETPQFTINLNVKTLETTITNLLRAAYSIQQAIVAEFTNAGITAYKLQSAATTNATSVTAVSTVLRNLNAYNTTATIYYLKLYNKASAPTVGTDVPVMTIPLAVTPTPTMPSLPAGLLFPLGLALAITLNATDSDNTAAVTGIQINLGYS